MNAASELFMSRGFSSTTMEEIAKRAELSPGLIYQYFKNKEDLYAALNLLSLDNLDQALRKINSDTKLSAEEKLIIVKDEIYSHFKANQLLIRNILHIQLEDTLPNISRETLNKLNEAGKKTQRVISNIFMDGVKEGIFKERFPVAVADTVWALFSGLVVWEEAKRKISPEKDFLKSTLDTAFEILCKGLR
jgi:AcrR family transcriptional regulator